MGSPAVITSPPSFFCDERIPKVAEVAKKKERDSEISNVIVFYEDICHV